MISLCFFNSFNVSSEKSLDNGGSVVTQSQLSSVCSNNIGNLNHFTNNCFVNLLIIKFHNSKGHNARHGAILNKLSSSKRRPTFNSKTEKKIDRLLIILTLLITLIMPAFSRLFLF